MSQFFSSGGQSIGVSPKLQWRHNEDFFFSHDEDIFSNYFQYCIFKCISEEFSIKSNNWLLEMSPSLERKNNDNDGN